MWNRILIVGGSSKEDYTTYDILNILLANLTKKELEEFKKSLNP